jgi:hypothetical protein
VRDPRGLGRGELEQWVLKPAWGRVGDGVGIAGLTEEREYAKILREARRRPGGWAAQERFEAAPVETDGGPRYPCIGVYTVEGRAAGAYGRLSERPLIDPRAQEAAVLVREG